MKERTKKLLGTFFSTIIFSNPLTAQEVYKALRDKAQQEKKDVGDISNSESTDVQSSDSKSFQKSGSTHAELAYSDSIFSKYTSWFNLFQQISPDQLRENIARQILYPYISKNIPKKVMNDMVELLKKFEDGSGILLSELNSQQQTAIAELLQKKITQQTKNRNPTKINKAEMKEVINSIFPKYDIDENRIFVEGEMVVLHADGKIEPFSMLDSVIPKRNANRALFLHKHELHPDNQQNLKSKLATYFDKQFTEYAQSMFLSGFKDFFKQHVNDACALFVLDTLYNNGVYQQIPLLAKLNSPKDFIKSLGAGTRPFDALRKLKVELGDQINTDIFNLPVPEMPVEVKNYLTEKIFMVFGDKPDIRNFSDKINLENIDIYSEKALTDLHQLHLARIRESRGKIATLIIEMRIFCKDDYAPKANSKESKNKIIKQIKKIKNLKNREEVISLLFAEADRRIVICEGYCAKHYWKYDDAFPDFHGYYNVQDKTIYLSTELERDHAIEIYPAAIGGELESDSNLMRTMIDEFLHAGADSLYDNLLNLYPNGDFVKQKEFEDAIERDIEHIKIRIDIAKKVLEGRKLQGEEQTIWDDLSIHVAEQIKRFTKKPAYVHVNVDKPPKGHSLKEGIGQRGQVRYPQIRGQHPLLSLYQRTAQVKIVDVDEKPLPNAPDYCLAKAEILNSQEIFDINYSIAEAIEDVDKILNPGKYNVLIRAMEVLNKIPYEKWGEAVVHNLLPNVSTYYENVFLSDSKEWLKKKQLSDMMQEWEATNKEEQEGIDEFEDDELFAAHFSHKYQK